MKQLLLKPLIKGSIVALPLLITIWLVWSALLWLDELGAQLFTLVGLTETIPGLGFVVVLISLLIVGVLFEFNPVSWLYQRVENALLRFPLVKTLYGAVRDFAVMFDRDKKENNQQVVLVNMGNMGQLVGFITSSQIPASVQSFYAEKDMVTVYLPMSYMVGGYTLFIEREKVTPVDWSFEDAMRFALTAGVSQSQATERNTTSTNNDK